MTEIGVAPRFDMGRVVNRTFGVISRNWQTLGGLALLLGTVPQGLVQSAQIMSQGSSGSPFGPLYWVNVVVSLLSSCLLQAAVIHGTFADLNGRRSSLGESLGTGLRFVLPVLGAGIVGGVCVALGIVLLIVPGVLIGLAWIVAIPVIVVERTGVFGSFARSAALTRNHRGSIFGLFVVYWLVLTVLAALVGVLTVGLGMTASGGRSIAAVIPTAILSGVIGLVGATGIASIYYELRNIKEGIGPDALASVFD